MIDKPMTYYFFKSIRFIVIIAALLLIDSVVRAEPVLVNVEATGILPLTEPQSKVFNPGGSIALGVLYPVHPMVLIGAGARLGLLLDANAHLNNWANPGTGGFGTLNGVVRLCPFNSDDDARRGVGPFIEASGAGALTGKLIRPGFDAGLGWGFELGPIDLAPTVRYMHIIHWGGLDPRDARLLLFGVEISFFDARKVEEKPIEPPKDRDHDGIVDMEDMCPDEPEDIDGFNDEDGCPDLDNDKDGIPDKTDKCPNEPEDLDGFEDEDGCPDPDNDKDGILDVNDKCPNEPETVNGIDDYDGCPDSGLFEMVNNRIVLEEEVLFDFSRVRIKRAAKPILQAIRELQRQHPEWISLRVEGHADVRGDPRYNQELSERRAQQVRKILVELGIPAKLIDAVGYGSMRPRDEGTTEESHQRNRRVEFVVLARLQQPEVQTATQSGAESEEDKNKPDVNAVQPEVKQESEENDQQPIESKPNETSPPANGVEGKEQPPDQNNETTDQTNQKQDESDGAKEESK
jgi:outer membrane protein OmpA-like peptidoglycan-associated protein